ncbi:Gfo/Idh/MocA family oxidoreductase [Nocardioides sp. B-3]|nr:Gfo/Idh/MocA family oxidoreductase [Nocardioides sp. B-3]UUZ58078.1 Gfo/Idh/MocA family oxidoreductase [Nocardioides sp. B-3]
MTTRWAVAGTGSMAEVFSADFAHVDDAEVVAVGSRTTDRAREFASRHGVATGCTTAELVASDVDVIYIATPHPQHHALAVAALEAGKPVVVEKAFTASLADTREVVDLARSKGVFCMEAMWTRFQPVVVEAKRLVADGAIGDVIAVRSRPRRLSRLRPGLSALRARARRRRHPRPRRLRHLDRPALPRHPRHGHGQRDPLRQRGRRQRRDPAVVRRRARRFPRLRAHHRVARTCGRLGHGRLHRDRAPLPPPDPARRASQRSRRRDDRLAVRGRGYVHEIDEVNRCLAAGLLESPTMPLDDTVAVQWVMEETLAQVSRSRVRAST